MKKVQEKYFKRKVKYNSMVIQYIKSINLIGNLRLVTFIVGFGVALYLYILKNYNISIVTFILSLIIFIYLIFKHNNEIKNKRFHEALLDINERALKRLNGDWKSFEDTGEEFQDSKHPYTDDLDIFGKGSLYQWINSCNTFLGRHKLRDTLSSSGKQKEVINEKQKAINELSKELDWRQEFNAEGMLIKENCINPEELFIWGKEENKLYRKKTLIILSYILPIITIILIILPFINPAVPYQIRLVAISIQIIILVPGNDKRNLALNTIYKYKDSIKVYEKMLQCIANKEFKSNQLINLKNNISNVAKYGAIEGINELIRTADMLSDRKNLFYIVIDILFLWDYHCMFRLERWRNLYGAKLKIWLDTIAEFEVLCSLSNIAYDNEEWVYPEICDNERILSAIELGHPLLGEKRICNNINMTRPVSVLLITGSNMSGKSTFLRTIGINLVLAYCGAPVCAKNFKCSIMDIYTCMRIRDDLEQSISSFYAEILRIKTIVEATKANKKVFFLLDEIFKGTNSIDRHLGAKVLIKQIGEVGAAGLVSTHDLELSELEKEYVKVKNYHFQEYYEDNDLRFDYKLRQGVSTTRNALYIIKMAGIELEE